LSDEELEEKIQRDKEAIQRIHESMDLSYKASFPESSVVSTQRVVCRYKEGEIHNAIILIYGDGTTKVKCPGNCWDCEYKEDD